VRPSHSRTEPDSRRRRVPWNELAEAALREDLANGLTHPIYRYPASMSPYLARSLILGLTKPGDLVVDPFCGGGTTAVEALAHGRRAVCSDLSQLACFVTRTKARPLSKRSLRILGRWVEETGHFIARASLRYSLPLVLEGKRYAPRTHGLLVAVRDAARSLTDAGARRAALLITLRVGQLCFHCRSNPPSPRLLLKFFEQVATTALDGFAAYAVKCSWPDWTKGGRRRLIVSNIDASSLASKLRAEVDRASLILTSPPYPGVHVLYHRWQVFGRRETTLPRSLLGIQDGHPESRYTMGTRHERENHTYFQRLGKVYSQLRDSLPRNTVLAQVVGFSDPRRQLERFRESMREAGYRELMYPEAAQRAISRVIPNRRWYSWVSPKRDSAREYLLIHVPR
jgi:hypothetical protein